MERVLIGADDSVESFAAARCAFDLAAGWNAVVRVLTAVADEAHAAAALGLLDHLRLEAVKRGLAPERIETVVRRGEASRCIVDEARAWPADMIVMGVSRHEGLRSPYVGSQTEHVLEFAACPVLVVPRPL